MNQYDPSKDQTAAPGPEPKPEMQPMQPTMRLRWKESAKWTDEETVPLLLKQTSWHYTYYKLQQWWADGSGKGEWRDVEIGE